MARRKRFEEAVVLCPPMPLNTELIRASLAKYYPEDLMSETKVTRKIVKWSVHTPPPEYTAVLSCGHATPSEYENGMSEEQRDECQKLGKLECYDCSKLAQEEERLEQQLRDIRAKKAGRA